MKASVLKIKLVLLTFVTIFGGIGTAFANSNKESKWTSCFNRDESKLYFRAQNDKRKLGQCSGETVFKVPKEFKLIETVDSGDKNFSIPTPGTKRTLLINNGRRVLVSQWNNLSKANKILVLEPNMANKKVKKHCVFDNFSDAYSARYNAKTKKIEVLLSLPKTLGGNDYRRIWKTCKI